MSIMESKLVYLTVVIFVGVCCHAVVLPGTGILQTIGNHLAGTSVPGVAIPEVITQVGLVPNTTVYFPDGKHVVILENTYELKVGEARITKNKALAVNPLGIELLFAPTEPGSGPVCRYGKFGSSYNESIFCRSFQHSGVAGIVNSNAGGVGIRPCDFFLFTPHCCTTFCPVGSTGKCDQATVPGYMEALRFYAEYFGVPWKETNFDALDAMIRQDVGQTSFNNLVGTGACFCDNGGTENKHICNTASTVQGLPGGDQTVLSLCQTKCNANPFGFNCNNPGYANDTVQYTCFCSCADPSEPGPNV